MSQLKCKYEDAHVLPEAQTGLVQGEHFCH